MLLQWSVILLAAAATTQTPRDVRLPFQPDDFLSMSNAPTTEGENAFLEELDGALFLGPPDEKKRNGSPLLTGGLAVTGHNDAAGVLAASHGHPVAGFTLIKHGEKKEDKLEAEGISATKSVSTAAAAAGCTMMAAAIIFAVAIRRNMAAAPPLPVTSLV